VQDRVRTAWVRADTYVLVALLARAKLKEIWRHWPEEENVLIRRAADTALRDRQRTRSEYHHSGTSASTLSSETLGTCASTQGPQPGRLRAWSQKLTFAASGHRSEAGEENQGGPAAEGCQTSILLGRLDRRPALTLQVPSLSSKQLEQGEQTPESLTQRSRSHVRKATSRSNVSFALSEAAKLCGEGSESSSEEELAQELTRLVDASTSTAEEPILKLTTPNLPAPQIDLPPPPLEPPERQQSSEATSVAQACVIQQLAALVQGQGMIQQQVTELVKRLTAFEDATVVLTAPDGTKA